MIILTPAKLNLYLKILNKRPDGFHELETLMTCIDIYDKLELNPIKKNIKFITNKPFGDACNDLCYKAADLFFRHHNNTCGIEIHLTKNIPDGAGLGGGSSDAAAILIGMQKIFGKPTIPIENIAAKLGSDVNFFIDGLTAWCDGRGEKINTITDAPALFAVVIFPKIHTPTPAVFKQFALTQRAHKVRLNDSQRSIFFAKPTFSNDLEQAACEYNNELKSCRERLKNLIPNNQIMLTGSGSAFFIICKSKKEAQNIKAKINMEKWKWPTFLVETNKQMIFKNKTRQGVCE